MEISSNSSISIKQRYSFTIQIQDYNITEGELSKIMDDVKRRCTFKSSTLHKITYQYEPYCVLDLNSSQLIDKILPNRHRKRMDKDLRLHHHFILSHKKRSDDQHRFEVVQNAPSDEKDHQLAFRICSTYPATVLLPYHVARPDYRDKLQEMIAFREKQRIPLVSYIFTDPYGRHSSLWRSGQLKTGMLGRRQDVDEEMISFIGSITFNEKNLEQKRCQIFDCRPYLNAVGNKIMGKGYLDPENYKINDVKFGNIANIHVMRKGLEDLLTGFSSGQGQAANRWVAHLQSILSGASFVRDKLLEGTSVLVNCSDGWDRTPQVVCLAKIMLEPYFRTLEGFQTLIHHEWICFGHKFKSRQYFIDNGEASPVFVQFLDCVHQMVIQLPEKFEFNANLPLVLAKAYIDNCFIEFNFDNTEQLFDHLFMDFQASKSEHVEFEDMVPEIRSPERVVGLFGKGNVQEHMSKKTDKNDQQYLYLPDESMSLSIWSLIYARIDTFCSKDYEYKLNTSWLHQGQNKQPANQEFKPKESFMMVGTVVPSDTAIPARATSRSSPIKFDQMREKLYDYLYTKNCDPTDVLRDLDTCGQSLEYWRAVYSTSDLKILQGKKFKKYTEGVSSRKRTGSNDEFCMLGAG